MPPYFLYRDIIILPFGMSNSMFVHQRVVIWINFYRQTRNKQDLQTHVSFPNLHGDGKLGAIRRDIRRKKQYRE